MRILIALSVVMTTPALAQLEILPAQTPQTADATLGCDQLQSELATALANPAVQTALQQQAVADAAPPAEEGKRKGGLFKKFGQAAGGLGAALGGGRGAAAALGTVQAVGEVGGDVGSAAQAAGALGGLAGGGDKLAAIGAAAQVAGAVGGGRGGAAGIANAAAVTGALGGRGGGLDSVALQALASQQLANAGKRAIADTPERMRAGTLLELGQAKNCSWLPPGIGAAK